MKKTLSTVLAVICIAAMLLSVFACEKKAPSTFVPMDTSGKLSCMVNDTESRECSKEEALKIAEIYNSLSSEGSYKNKEYESAEWRSIIVSEPEGGQPTVFMISYLGDYRFAVKVDGSSKGQYAITSHELFSALTGE